VSHGGWGKEGQPQILPLRVRMTVLEEFKSKNAVDAKVTNGNRRNLACA
jgi:hypothetical protein